MVQRIAEVGAERIAISIIVACEVRFGLALSGSQRLIQNMERVLEQIEVLPMEAPVEEHYADIRTALERAGTEGRDRAALTGAYAMPSNRSNPFSGTGRLNR